TGGGVVNSGPEASHFLRELVKLTGFPITSTLMVLGAYAASDPSWLRMLCIHGTYEPKLAIHDCEVMISMGARCDAPTTGRLEAFSPGPKNIHADLDPPKINKTAKVAVPITGDCAHGLEDVAGLWRPTGMHAEKAAPALWGKQTEKWPPRQS